MIKSNNSTAINSAEDRWLTSLFAFDAESISQTVEGLNRALNTRPPLPDEREINEQLDIWTQGAQDGEKRVEAATRIRTALARKDEQTILNLSNLGLRSEGFPAILGQLTWLEEIDLSHNRLTAVPFGLLTTWENPIMLEPYPRIDLSYNQITDTRALKEDNFERLGFLDLRGNKITKIPPIPDAAAELRLRWLDLRDNQITSVPYGVSKFRSRVSIQLQGNPIRLDLPQAKVFLKIRNTVKEGTGPVLWLETRNRSLFKVCGEMPNESDEESESVESYVDPEIEPQEDACGQLATTMQKYYRYAGGMDNKKHARLFEFEFWEQLLKPVGGNERNLQKYAENLNRFLTRIETELKSKIDHNRIRSFLDSIATGGYACLEEIGNRVVDAFAHCADRPLRTFLILEGALKLKKIATENRGVSELVDVFKELFIVDCIMDEASTLANARSQAKEGIEFELRLFEMLQTRFPLPFAKSVKSVHGHHFKISQADADFVGDRIAKDLQGKPFIDYLSKEALWREACAESVGKDLARLNGEFQGRCTGEEIRHELQLKPLRKKKDALAALKTEMSGNPDLAEDKKQELLARLTEDLLIMNKDLQAAELEKGAALGEIMNERNKAIEKLYLEETRSMVASMSAMNMQGAEYWQNNFFKPSSDDSWMSGDPLHP